uniref:Pept_C1 domain-containing protein n=1 Tax=Heterorhabditis bacteriophora TaxID=37862 RepID=A0A1I7XMP2_HETBA
MYEKERRSSLEEPQERRRRNLCFITIAVILCFIAIVVLYMQSLEVAQETKINDDYLRKLVRQINDSPKTTWKAKFNKFGVRNKSYGFKYTRNATAIEKYVEKINQFFDSALMKKHIQELMEFPEGDLPTHFDARLKWPYCPSISHVPNQGGCGSCYIRNILMKEIFLFGSTTMAFPVPEEFLHYSSGTFKINVDSMEKYGLEYEAGLV